MLADQFVAAAARNTHTVDEVVRLTWRVHAAHPGSRGSFRQPLSTSSAVHTVSSRTNLVEARVRVRVGMKSIVKVRHGVRRP